MRQKRAKAYKRLMALYSQSFGFRPPFQILVASDMLIEASHKDLELWNMLKSCVQGECKPMITQCSVEALYRMGKEYQRVVDVAKSFERRRCNHREAQPEKECLVDVVGPTNKHRYTLALQDGKQRAHYRAIPGIPIIHFNDRGVMVMELPSQATLRKKELDERGKLTEQSKLPLPLDLPNVVGAQDDASPATATPSKPARRKVKGPNPLSVRKKKAEPTGPQRKSPAQTRTDGTDGTDDEQPPKRAGKRARDEEGSDDEGGAAEGSLGNGAGQTGQCNGTGAPKKRKRKRPQKTASAA